MFFLMTGFGETDKFNVVKLKSKSGFLTARRVLNFGLRRETFYRKDVFVKAKKDLNQ